MVAGLGVATLLLASAVAQLLAVLQFVGARKPCAGWPEFCVSFPSFNSIALNCSCTHHVSHIVAPYITNVLRHCCGVTLVVNCALWREAVTRTRVGVAIVVK